MVHQAVAAKTRRLPVRTLTGATERLNPRKSPRLLRPAARVRKTTPAKPRNITQVAGFSSSAAPTSHSPLISETDGPAMCW